jgi:hypothetical protein
MLKRVTKDTPCAHYIQGIPLGDKLASLSSLISTLQDIVEDFEARISALEAQQQP